MSYCELSGEPPLTRVSQVLADNQWPVVGAKMGLPSAPPPEGGPDRSEAKVAELLSKIYTQYLSQIEKLWFQFSRVQPQAANMLNTGNSMVPQPLNGHLQPPTQLAQNMMSPQYRVS